MYPISQSRDSQASQVGQASRQITGLGEEKKAASSGKGLSVQQVGQNVRTFSSLKEVEQHKEHLNLNTLRAVVIGDVPFILKEVGGQIKFVPDDESIQAKLQQGQEKQGVNIYEIARTLNDIMKKEMIFRENIKILCQRLVADSKEINNKDLLCKSGNVRVIDQACEKIDQTLLKKDELQANDIAGIFKRTLATLSPVTQDDFAHMATDPQGACHSLDDTIAYHYSLQPEKENNFRVMLEALCEYFNLDGKSGGEVLDRKNELSTIALRLFSKVKIDLNKITTYKLSAICKAVLSNWRNVHDADTSVTPGTLSKGEGNSIQTTNLRTLCQKIESIAENPKENMGLFREVGK
ncbi:hypothetical protein BK025_12010 [Sodalis sp. TME1]|nr:hypothetical protein BK025_12010 [Sodalis sp. TME1]